MGLKGDPSAVLKAITAVKTRSRTTLDVARQVAVRLDAKFVTPDEKSQKEIAKDPAGYHETLVDAVAVLKNDARLEEVRQRRGRNRSGLGPANRARRQDRDEHPTMFHGMATVRIGTEWQIPPAVTAR